MKSKILPSLIAVMFAMPAMAEAPADGLFLKGQYYGDAATYDTLGTYEGPVDMDAIYGFVVSPGYYLPANASAVAPCPTNSYCPGLASAVEASATPQGVESCTGDFTHSDGGTSATSAGACYTDCTMDDVINAEHANGASGKKYASGVNSCGVESCEYGYHSGTDNTDYAEVINDWLMEQRGCIKYINANGYRNEDCGSGFSSESAEWISGSLSEHVNEPNEWLIGWKSDSGPALFIKGKTSECQYNANATSYAELFLCKCALSAYYHARAYVEQQYNGIDGSAPAAVFEAYVETLNDCSNCAKACAEYIQENAANLGPTLLEAPLVPYCIPNVININWANAVYGDLPDYAKTDINTCRFGETIRTPPNAQEVEGKRFLGWRVIKPSQE